MVTKGKCEFTVLEINELKRLISLRNNTPSNKQKLVRDKMRKIGFYGKDDWGIVDCQLSDLENLIKSKRITIINPNSNNLAVNAGNSLKALSGKEKFSQTKHIDSFEKQKLKEGIERARLKYKPERVKILLIAEAPPDSVERFFYYENVASKDYLFLGIVQALYPKLKEEFILSNRSIDKKTALLNNLKKDGFYLLDLSDLPKSWLNIAVEVSIMDLLKKVKTTVDKNTKIILIKKHVYRCVYKPLKEMGYNVINKEISFPSSGQQKVFQNQFSEALELTGYY